MYLITVAGEFMEFTPGNMVRRSINSRVNAEVISSNK